MQLKAQEAEAMTIAMQDDYYQQVAREVEMAEDHGKQRTKERNKFPEPADSTRLSGTNGKEGVVEGDAVLGRHQSTLEALTAQNRTTTQYHYLDTPAPPALSSDINRNRKTPNRGTDESTATWASFISSVISGRSGLASTNTSPSNSRDLDPIFRRRENREGRVPETSRFSTFTIESVDEKPGDIDKHDAFISKGPLYKLVQATAQTGILGGVVDVYQREAFDLKFTTFRTAFIGRLFRMIENPETYIERDNAFDVLLPPDPRDTIAKIILATPASSSRPDEAPQSIEHSPNALSPPHSPGTLSRSRQHSVSSTATSFHSALSDRPASEHSLRASSHHPWRPQHATKPSIASVFDAAETKDDDFLSELPVSKPESPIESGTVASWKQRASWNSNRSAETHNSAEGEIVETENETVTIDVRIFHPTLEITAIVIALCDPQSSHSHISPKALDRLGITLDNNLIKKTQYQYQTNDGAIVTARGKIDKLTWREFRSNGDSRHHTNSFYIAGDDAPYEGVLLGKDHLFPKNGPPRISYNRCLVTIREQKTAEQKEKAEKAKKEQRRRIKENEKLKKEQMAAAAALQAQHDHR